MEKKGKKPCRTHSIRVSDDTWESWQDTAAQCGLSVTKTLVQAMTGMAGKTKKIVFKVGEEEGDRYAWVKPLVAIKKDRRL